MLFFHTRNETISFAVRVTLLPTITQVGLEEKPPCLYVRFAYHHVREATLNIVRRYVGGKQRKNILQTKKERQQEKLRLKQ